jgi:vacuolar-type H+-ATPase subunit H
MAILQLVDKLGELLDRAWAIPLTPYRLIDGRDFEANLERMRISVPSSIRESERTIAERDKIIATARAEAERLIQEAQMRAHEMLTERSLLATAQSEADRIVEESREVARRRADEADAYTMQVLHELGRRLQTMLAQVENGISLMQQDTQPTRNLEVPEKRLRAGAKVKAEG